MSGRGSTRPTSTNRSSIERERACSRSTRCASTRRTTSRRGGTRAFSEYYLAKYDGAQFQRSLIENVVFAQHNLVSDRSFNEFNVIICRNVMIYFDRALQNRVHELFFESLVTFGVLGLGHKESIHFSPHEKGYEELDAREKLYRKIGYSCTT